jgi:uncharacterized repeat protein (TIGR03803 family)
MQRSNHSARHCSVITATVALLLLLASGAQAQTFSLIYSFTGSSTGEYPGELTIDKAGNLYGFTSGGTGGAGLIWELKQRNGSWQFITLYAFQGGNDGGGPQRVIFGPDGALYGVTEGGGTTGSGTVFRLAPKATFCPTVLCPWEKTILYNFTGDFNQNDGYEPVGPVTFDAAGNIYGVTYNGGEPNQGIAWKLTKSNGSWSESILHTFGTGNDGALPTDGVILDPSGNVYGTTSFGGAGQLGTVYELSPSGSGYTETILHDFAPGGDAGEVPVGGLIFDPSGDLLGTTTDGGNEGGTVFMLTPGSGSWTISVLAYISPGTDGPFAMLFRSPAGNLYGTTLNNPSAGAVFEVTPNGGGWTYSNLYVFRDGGDGGHPDSNVVMDANGNLYGTALYGGGGYCDGNGCGTVWEIRP